MLAARQMQLAHEEQGDSSHPMAHIEQLEWIVLPTGSVEKVNSTMLRTRQNHASHGKTYSFPRQQQATSRHCLPSRQPPISIHFHIIQLAVSWEHASTHAVARLINLPPVPIADPQPRHSSSTLFQVQSCSATARDYCRLSTQAPAGPKHPRCRP
jgi:hypothetical protein